MIPCGSQRKAPFDNPGECPSRHGEQALPLLLKDRAGSLERRPAATQAKAEPSRRAERGFGVTTQGEAVPGRERRDRPLHKQKRIPHAARRGFGMTT